MNHAAVFILVTNLYLICNVLGAGGCTFGLCVYNTYRSGFLFCKHSSCVLPPYKKLEVIINHSQVLFWEDQLRGRGREQWLLNPNHRYSCTLLKSSSPFSVCPCYLLKSEITPLGWRLVILVLKIPAFKLWGQVWCLPSLTALRNQNACACYVGKNICLTLTKDSVYWWTSYNELASWAGVPFLPHQGLLAFCTTLVTQATGVSTFALRCHEEISSIPRPSNFLCYNWCHLPDLYLLFTLGTSPWRHLPY